MRKLSLGMNTVSQAVAIGIILAFLVGMRWQDGFYDELGFPWISGYSNYLDTMRAGVPIVKIYLIAATVGWFSIWMLSNWKYESATASLIFCGVVLIPMGDLITPWFESIESPEYLVLRSNYQIISTGFFIGGILKLLTNTSQQLDIEEMEVNSKIVPYTLIIISIAMIGVFDSPKSLGSATAQKAILTGFKGYSVVTDNRNTKWHLIGYSQGNLILARALYQKNTIEIKVSNNTSELTIYPASPIRSAGVL